MCCSILLYLVLYASQNAKYSTCNPLISDVFRSMIRIISWDVYVLFLLLKYRGRLVMKNNTESSAISPGKKRYIASLNPIASPTHSMSIPRVPTIFDIVSRLIFQWCYQLQHSWQRWRMQWRLLWWRQGRSQPRQWTKLQTRSQRRGNTELK